jgi:hypothetical protein
MVRAPGRQAMMDWGAEVRQLAALRAEFEAVNALDDNELQAAIPYLLALSSELLERLDTILEQMPQQRRS